MSKSNNDPCRTPIHRSTTRTSAITAGDESPTLSQEPVKVTWKWNSENTPIRSTAGSSKLKFERLSKKSPINGNLYRRSITSSASKKKYPSPCTATTTLSNSPRGLFKFEEEMRKIQFDSNETEKCDNDDSDMQPLSNVVGSVNTDKPSVRRDEDNKMDIGVATTTNLQSATVDNLISDPFKQDLLNDSDFDQMLLTCTEGVEKNFSQEQLAPGTVVKIPAEAESNVTVEPSQSNNYMSLFNDESIDDILGNIDDSFIMHSINVKNSKLSRHKSMPQELQQQKSQSEPKKLTSLHHQQPQNSTATMNRKSFARHESMPISPISATAVSGRQSNVQISKWISGCVVSLTILSAKDKRI